MGRTGLGKNDPSISRRELRGLCKQHGLPTNGRKQDLAKSLDSLFTKMSFSSSPDDHLPLSSPSELKPKDQAKLPDFRRKYVARKNSSVAGAYKRIACLKENRTKRKREKRSSSQLMVESLSGAPTAELPSTSDKQNIHVSPKCPETRQPDRAEKRPEPKKCSTGSISPDTDEFHFFVSSEDGISLLIDLDSKPSDWIKSLKKEIYVTQTFPHENGHLDCINDQLNSSSINLKVPDGSSGCGNSPFSSLLSEVHHVVDDDTPKSCIPSSELGDPNQLVSFSCDAASDLLVHDNQSGLRDVETYASGNSPCLEKLNSVNSPVDLNEGRSMKFDHLEHQIVESDMGEGSSWHVPESTSAKSSVCLSNERCDTTRLFKDYNQENHAEVSINKVMTSVDVEYHTSDDTSQAHVQQNLACSANEGEPDSSNHDLDQKSHETQVKLNKEQSKQSKTSKRTCDPEIRGNIRRGRPRKNQENADLTSMISRGPKTNDKGSSSRFLASHRRSTRLMSKEP